MHPLTSGVFWRLAAQARAASPAATGIDAAPRTDLAKLYVRLCAKAPAV